MTRRHAPVVLGALLILGLAIGSSCGGGNAAWDKAKQLVAAGKPLEALVEYERAIKADPRQAQAIKAEADEQVVAKLMPQVVADFGAGDFAAVINATKGMVALRSNHGEPFLYYGLARISMALQRAIIDTRGMLNGYKALNQYISMMPPAERNKSLIYPRYLYAWLLASYQEMEKQGAPVTRQRFASNFSQPNLLEGIGGDDGYIFRSHYLSSVARRIAGDADKPAEKASRLFDHVVRAIQPEMPGVPARDVRPFDVVYSGWGAPKSIAWATVELARQLDLMAWIQLEPKPGSKPTDPRRFRILVTLWTGEAWTTLDPESGLRSSKAPGKDSVLLVAAEPKAFYPRIRLVQHLLGGHVGDTPRFFVGADPQIAFALKQLHGRDLTPQQRASLRMPLTEKEKPTIHIWRYPFELDAQFLNRKFRDEHKAWRVRGNRYDAPRLKQLGGQYDEALEVYETLIAKPDLPEDARADCAFHRVECIELLGKTKDAIAGYRKLLAAKSPWEVQIRLRLGALLIAQGQKVAAAEILAGVKGPRSAAAKQLAGG